MPLPETTTDAIGGLSIRQPSDGYRFSMDPILLSAFVGLKSPKKIADFGSGTGIAGLLLARRFPRSHVTLVELQPDLHELGVANIKDNQLDDRVSALNIDIKEMRTELTGLDVVVSNPPFRLPGTGRMSKGQSAPARHELQLPLGELCSAAARALRGKGRFYMVYLPERMVELTDALRNARLEPKRMRFVHGRTGLEARILLIEAVRDGSPGMKVEPPLFVYQEDSDEYTDEVAAIYSTA